jgi:hypothetical protein
MEDILPQMLNGANLSSLSLQEDPLINTEYITVKSCRIRNSSNSNAISSYCSSNKKMIKYVKMKIQQSNILEVQLATNFSQKSGNKVIPRKH